MMRFFYTGIYFVVLCCLQVLARFLPNTKLYSFIHGRDNLLLRWQKAVVNNKKTVRIWFHVSSVGELEQVRPILQYWRELRKDYAFFLTYYSPEVLRVVKDWSFVDYADFLPFDFPHDSNAFLQTLQPSLLVLNRYDLWPNLFYFAKQKNISIALVNASTPPLGFMGRIGLLLRRPMFQQVKVWTYVDAMAASAWEPYLDRNANAQVTGNPRVDRVLARIHTSTKLQELNNYLKKFWCFEKNQTIIAGSVWENDAVLLLKAYAILRQQFPNIRLILVPHEPSEEHIKFLEKRCEQFSYCRYSQLQTASSLKNTAILIIDQRGFLAELYGVGAIAFVGGGFGKQVHSVIEPAAHGLSVAFGPHHQRSPEAAALVFMGAAFVCQKANHYCAQKLAQWLAIGLNDSEENRKLKQKIGMYLNLHRGAGERTAKYLDQEWKKLYASTKSI